MLNEFAYCPRLVYLMWVQKEWAENVETLEGKHAHRRVDKEPGERAQVHNRSVELSSAALGLIAVCDLVERDGRRARPVDYKRGKRPPVADGAYEPERVQLCAQGLLLREHGYTTNEGLLYYVASKERVRVRFTRALVERTLELLADMRRVLGAGTIPPPLEDSPKCPRCSLVSICLPEEVRFLRSGGAKPRPLAASDPATFPLVVQEPGAGVRLRGERLLVEAPGGGHAEARLVETSHLVLMGGARCSTPALHECCQRGIPVLHLSGTGWFYGITRGLDHKNVELRSEQFAAARDAERSLAIGRAVVAAKIRNARVLLRRNGEPSRHDLELLAGYARRALEAGDAEELLGLEGNAARTYYAGLPSMLKAGGDGFAGFAFEGRNRRPPRDPVNALLSFAYSLLTKDWVVTLTTVGLDPLMGFYHQPKYGKPALALDLMEPFRPVIADSVVVSAVNNGEVRPGDFFEREGGILLRPAARKRLIAAYERRLGQKVRHPLFSYRCTYRRIFELEARLLSRHLLGEIPTYRPFEVR
jgi:CRISPR-associated endonuclease Cas1/CRISPR-associated protein Cas4